MKNKLSEGSTALNAYHQERSKAACKEVNEMIKHPISFEQAKAQTERIKEGMRRPGRPALTMKNIKLQAVNSGASFYGAGV